MQSPVSDFLCDEHLPAHAMQRFKHMPILDNACRVVGAGVYSQEDTIYILFNPCPNPPIRFNNKGAYYHLPGTGSGANKWYVHHQGGGWCESLDDCLSRSKVRLYFAFISRYIISQQLNTFTYLCGALPLESAPASPPRDMANRALLSLVSRCMLMPFVLLR